MTLTTAMAYGPDTPSAKPGVRTITDCEVIVLSSLDVGEHDEVTVETLPGGRGMWCIPGMRLVLHRHQLGHVRRPGYHRKAAVNAKCAMSTLASRMHPASGPLRSTDPVAYWDLRASMDDRRASLCLAIGIPVEDIRRDGYHVVGGE